MEVITNPTIAVYKYGKWLLRDHILHNCSLLICHFEGITRMLFHALVHTSFRQCIVTSHKYKQNSRYDWYKSNIKGLSWTRPTTPFH